MLTHEEIQTSHTLLLASRAAALNTDAETAARAESNTSARRWKVSLASVAGAALIGVTSGLAAPVVVGAIGGAHGLVNGRVDDPRDIVKPWRKLESQKGEDEDMGHRCEAFALRYETNNSLVELGSGLKDTLGCYAWSMINKLEILKRTVLATLWGALWPVYLLKMATGIDNPSARAKRRAEKAGEVLADALINRAHKVIYSCLRSLAKRHAFGLIDSIVVIGSRIPSSNISRRGEQKKKGKEEESVIDFGDVAELEAPVPLVFEQFYSIVTSVASYGMDDLQCSTPPTPAETSTSMTTTRTSTTHLTLPSKDTRAPIVRTNTTALPSIIPPLCPPPPRLPSYSPEDEEGILIIDNDDELDMPIHTSGSTSGTGRILSLSRNDSGNTENGMSGLLVTQRSIDDVKHDSPVEPKRLGSLPRGGDFGSY
ncbi:hypothetical protein NHQ30_003941 [Ciborinia camelliae]|nr:hypothetical protein NHQ30_003941 [Ciborinia camelliae]